VWTRPQKVLAAVVVPMAMPLLLFFLSERSMAGWQICIDPPRGAPPSDEFGCFDQGPATWKLVLYATAAVGAVAVALWLWTSAGRRRRSQAT
jgi:hypothetical protein